MSIHVRTCAHAITFSFRNVYTYLDDCWLQGVSPSLPQLLLMLDSAEISLAFSFGPDWLMRALSYSMGVVVGRWFGGCVLGYSASYPEYWDESCETKKGRGRLVCITLTGETT